jgi:hypothetical protein
MLCIDMEPLFTELEEMEADETLGPRPDEAA